MPPVKLEPIILSKFALKAQKIKKMILLVVWVLVGIGLISAIVAYSVPNEALNQVSKNIFLFFGLSAIILFIPTVFFYANSAYIQDRSGCYINVYEDKIMCQQFVGETKRQGRVYETAIIYLRDIQEIDNADNGIYIKLANNHHALLYKKTPHPIGQFIVYKHGYNQTAFWSTYEALYKYYDAAKQHGDKSEAGPCLCN